MNQLGFSVASMRAPLNIILVVSSFARSSCCSSVDLKALFGVASAILMFPGGVPLQGPWPAMLGPTWSTGALSQALQGWAPLDGGRGGRWMGAMDAGEGFVLFSGRQLTGLGPQNDSLLVHSEAVGYDLRLPAHVPCSVVSPVSSPMGTAPSEFQLQCQF